MIPKVLYLGCNCVSFGPNTVRNFEPILKISLENPNPTSIKLKDQVWNICVVQLLSPVQLFATLWIAAHQASLSITNSQSLLKLMSVESMMPSNHLILCHPLLFLPSIFSSITVFSNESVLHIRWPKYWSFSFSISPSNEYSGLISFRIDWFDLFAVQENLKSLLQHQSSKELILQHLAFFIYGPTLTSIHDSWRNKFLKINILSTRLTKTIKTENIK